ncbi:MAG: site-2 protease family protein [Clostridia bacterium]|nr:site-2 protease family protein [Clostridia bacterium]
MTILIAILIFGFLIFIHELGHYLTARLFKVGINEFALGMGPKILSKTSKKTGIVYSFRLLPIGGFVSMVGEDEDSDDENALNNKPVWQRMIIVAAGAFMNVLVGVLVVLIIVCSTKNLATNIVAEFDENSQLVTQGLMVNDEIVKIGNQRVFTGRDMLEAVMFEGADTVDVTVKRDGKLVVLKDVDFPRLSQGKMTFGTVDFKVYGEGRSFVNIIKHTIFYSKSTVNMIWKSLLYLVTGKVGVEQMSGPIGVTSAIGTAAKSGLTSLLDLTAMLALNLGIFNMLPFPALDGGRFVFMIYELIFKKPIKREVEGYIHFAGLCLLMLLMVVVGFNDVRNLFK